MDFDESRVGEHSVDQWTVKINNPGSCFRPRQPLALSTGKFDEGFFVASKLKHPLESLEAGPSTSQTRPAASEDEKRMPMAKARTLHVGTQPSEAALTVECIDT